MSSPSQHSITAVAIGAAFPGLSMFPGVDNFPGSDILALQIIDASVTLDEGWSPYAQASITCWTPDAATLDKLDPRLSPRVVLTLTQGFGTSLTFADFNARWAGKTVAQFNAFYAGKTIAEFNAGLLMPWDGVSYREPVKLTLDLSIRSRTVDHENGTVTFSLTSDEAILQDFALVATNPADPATTSVRSAIFYALAKIGVSSLAGTLDATVDAAATVWQPGVSAWDYVAPLVQKAGFRLWCDGGRVWRLTKGYTADGQVNLSAETGVKRATDTVSREAEWFDSVVITYKWNDTAGVSHVAYDTAGAPGTKALAINYDATVFPGAGAATGVLERAQGRGRVLDVEALSNYDTAPGIALSITLPNTPIQTGVVSAVTWQFPADTMTVKSRGLIDTSASSWQLTPAGRRWQDVATGIKWNTYTP